MPIFNSFLGRAARKVFAQRIINPCGVRARRKRERQNKRRAK